ncbi:hypothetical protein D1007_04173 [Hordeum vulgare]|nr:hypothetical protein D1007_04173 [Hordeum vulgare]
METRLEAMEQQVFKCQGMVERGLNANHMMITEFTSNHKMDAIDIGKHLSRLYDRVDQLQGQIYDLQNQNSSGALVSRDSAEKAVAATAAAGKLPFLLLTRTNYAAWAMRMKYLLRANGAWAAVNHEVSSTEVDKGKEDMAMTIISQSIDDTTLLRVAEKETAADGRETGQEEEQLLVARRHVSLQGRGCGGRGRGHGRDGGRRDKSEVQCYNCDDFGPFAWECLAKKENEERAMLASYSSNIPTLL